MMRPVGVLLSFHQMREAQYMVSSMIGVATPDMTGHFPKKNENPREHVSEKQRGSKIFDFITRRSLTHFYEAK